jgi:hypothetical protein
MTLNLWTTHARKWALMPIHSVLQVDLKRLPSFSPVYVFSSPGASDFSYKNFVKWILCSYGCIVSKLSLQDITKCEVVFMCVASKSLWIMPKFPLSLLFCQCTTLMQPKQTLVVSQLEICPPEICYKFWGFHGDDVQVIFCVVMPLKHWYRTATLHGITTQKTST